MPNSTSSLRDGSGTSMTRAISVAARRALRRSRRRAAALCSASSPQLDMTVAVAMPVLEQLESRRLMDGMTQSGFALTLDGNASGNNSFDIQVIGTGLRARVNGQERWMNADSRITLFVNGGSGSDSLTVGSNVAYPILVNAGAGNDSIQTGSGNDTVVAGAGTDSVDGGAGNDFAVDAESMIRVEQSWNSGTNGSTGGNTGGVTTTPPPASGTMPASMRLDTSGNLYVTGSTTSANTIKVTLDSTSTKLYVQANADAYTFNVVDVKWLYLTGGNANDLIDAGANNPIRANIYGLGGNDSLSGSAAGDAIWGAAGNDTIDARDGSDWLDGGDDNDTILGGTGADTLNGGNGNDSLDGGAWADTLIGGAGTDVGINGETLDGIESNTSGGSNTGGNTGGSTGGSTGGDTGTGGNTGGSNGGLTGAGTPPTVGNTASPVARITAPVGLSVIAGQAVHVDGLSSSLNAGQVTTARYEWDFGDTTASSKYNKLVGFNASHVYNTPGTYTVTLRVINEGGKTATTTATVNVSADTRPTIYVSYYGNDNNSGSSEGSPVRSWNRVVQLAGNVSNVRVLFKRGETFDVSTTEWWINGDNVSVGAYGSGANPVIRYVGPRDRRRFMLVTAESAQGTSISDLTFDSIYTSTDGDAGNMPTAIFLNGDNNVVRNVQFLNVGLATNTGPTATGVMTQDNTSPLVTGLRDYFMWVEGTNVVAVGNTVANSTREHIIRLSGASRVLVSGNNLTNLDRTSIDRLDAGKGVVAAQKGSYYYVVNNKLNGPTGFGPLGLANGLNDKSARTLNGVFESNYQTGAQFEIRHGAENIMVRNNIFDRDNGIAINLEGFDTSYNRGSSNIAIINNTGINDGTTGNFLRMTVPIDGVKLLNNLYVAPQLSIGGWGAAPVAVLGSNLSSFTQIDSNNWGMPKIGSWAQGGINIVGTTDASSTFQDANEWNGFYQVGTDLFVTATLNSSYKPTANAGTAMSVGGVFTDYYGNYRPNAGWTIGAVQA